MYKMSHKKNKFTTVILILTLSSLIMLSSCNESNPNEISDLSVSSSMTTNNVVDSENSTEKESVDNYVPIKITNEDVANCINIIEKDNDFTVIDSDIYDIDFDGDNEVLLLADVPFRSICVFKKENGKMIQTENIGMGDLADVESLKLHTYSDDGEKYPFFTFHFDNGGVMKCDVLAAIKQVNGSYNIEFLLSFGTLDYFDVSEPFTKEFYRVGWNKNDLALDGDYNDISKEEFLEIYEKYKDFENIN